MPFPVGINFLLLRVLETSNCSNGGLQDTSAEVLHIILCEVIPESSESLGNVDIFDFISQLASSDFRNCHAPFPRPGITVETREAFLQTLRRDFPRELVPIVLAPWLYPEDSELSMDKLVSDSTAMSHTMVSMTPTRLRHSLGNSSYLIYY